MKTMYYHALLAISLEEHLPPIKALSENTIGVSSSRACSRSIVWDYSKYYGKGSYWCFLPFLPDSFVAKVSLTPLQSCANISTFLEKTNANFLENLRLIEHKSYWVHGLPQRKRNYFMHITDLGLWRTEWELNLPHPQVSLVTDTHSQLKWWVR